LATSIAKSKVEKEEWRYCERSEAITITTGDCFVVLRTPRNDVRRSLFLLPSVHHSFFSVPSVSSVRATFKLDYYKKKLPLSSFQDK